LQFSFFGCRRHDALLNVTRKRSIKHCNNNAKKNNWGQIPITYAKKNLRNNQGRIKNNS
jgi:hypothetical protein